MAAAGLLILSAGVGGIFLLRQARNPQPGRAELQAPTPQPTRSSKNLYSALRMQPTEMPALVAPTPKSTPEPESNKLLDMARRLVREGSLQNALLAYRKFLLEQPNSYEGHFELGLLCADLKDVDCAVSEINKALEFKPRSEEALEALGAILLEAGRETAAIETYRKIVRLDPTKPGPALKLAQVLDELEQANDAEVAYRNFLQKFPQAPEAAAVQERFTELTEARGEILVPIQRSGSAILVQGQVESAKDVQFLIDTGSTLTIISTLLGQELGFDLNAGGYQYVQMRTANGPIQAPVVTLQTLSIGKAVAHNVKAVIYDVDSADPVDGLLGLSFLDHFTFTIDSGAQVMHLERKK